MQTIWWATLSSDFIWFEHIDFLNEDLIFIALFNLLVMFTFKCTFGLFTKLPLLQFLVIIGFVLWRVTFIGFEILDYYIMIYCLIFLALWGDSGSFSSKHFFVVVWARNPHMGRSQEQISGPGRTGGPLARDIISRGCQELVWSCGPEILCGSLGSALIQLFHGLLTDKSFLIFFSGNLKVGCFVLWCCWSLVFALVKIYGVLRCLLLMDAQLVISWSKLMVVSINVPSISCCCVQKRKWVKHFSAWFPSML